MDDINDILVKIEEELDQLLNDSSKDDMVFVKHGLLPMDFFMKPAVNQVEANILKKFKKLVEIFGGKLSFSMSGRSPNVIVFSLFKHINFTSDYDVFLAQYLIDCFKAGTLLDLKQYRATKSKYPSSLEPNEIALGLKSWSDFQKEKENSGEEASDFSDNEGSSLVNLGKPPNFVASTSCAKNYSREEELVILNYIISQRYYFRVKGNMIWKRMEEKKICGRRSWQSMKQRYLKHIIPGIDHFNLSPEMKTRILATFNKGANARTRFAKTAEPSKSESENDFCDSETEKNVTTKNCSSSLSDTEVEDFSNKNTSDRTTKKSLILSNEDQSSDNSDSSFSPLVSNMKVGHNSESYIEENNLPHPEGNCSDKDNPVQQDVNVISTQSQHICNKEKQPTENGTDSVISSINEIRKPIHHSEPNRSPKSPTPKVNNGESDTSVVSESETENFAQRHNICRQETSYHDHECRLLLSPLNCYSTFPEPAQIENRRTSGHDSDETTIFNRIELIEEQLGRTSDICETEEKSEEEPLPKSVAFIQKSPVGNQNTGIYSKKKSSCESENPQVKAKCRNTQTSSEDDSDKEIPYQLGHKRKQIIAPKTLPRFNCSSSDCESGATSKVIKNHERKHSKNNQAHYSSKAATSHSGSRDLTSPDSKIENKNHDRKQRRSAPSSSPVDFSDDSTEGVYIVGKMKMYSKANDISILKHLYKYNLFNKVGGRAVWEDMEARNVVPGRSWHSLKERFRKRIVPRLNRYKHLPPKLIQNLQKELGGGENSVPSQRRQKNSIKYTLDEDERILEFISSNKRYKEIKGKAMWVAMSKIYNHARTWESLKNRFLKNIVPHLYLFDLDEGVRANFEKVLKSKGKEKQTSFSRPGPYQRNRLRVGMKRREEESCTSSSSHGETTDVSSDEETAKENTKPAEKEQATVGSCSADKDPQASDFSHSSATRNNETKHELEASFYTEPELKLDSKDVTVFEEPLFPTSSQDSASEGNTRDSSHNRDIPSKAGIKPKRVKLYSMEYDLFNKTPNPTGKSNSNPKMPSDAHSLANHSGEGKTLTVSKKTEGATALPTCSSEPRNVKSNSNENLLSSQNVSPTKKYGRGMKNAGCTPSDRRESDVIPRVSLTPVEYMPEFHEMLRDPPQKRITTKGISLDTDIKRRRIRRTNIFT